MASRKLTDPPDCYDPVPQDVPHQHQDYIILPLYIPAVLRRQWRRHLISAATLLLISVSLYFLWPSDPDLTVVRLRLERVQLHTAPRVALDITLNLKVKVRNPDVYSIDYRSLVVSIGYRGKELGFVTSDRGHVRARGSSYVDATLELNGVEVLSDVIMLLEDLARGSVPFDTVTEVNGQLGLFFFELPLKAKVSCEVYVNTHTQTVSRQNCYPE